jgi:hypothetical protein
MMRSLRWIVPLAAVVLTACGGDSPSSAPTASGSSSSSGSHDFSGGGANVVALTVGPGPQNPSVINIPTTTVKICQPGTTTCATISHVLVDTGSPGLRLLASALSGFTPQNQQDQSVAGNFIVECLPFADGFTWGPVATVDVVIGGERANSVPVNVIDDTANHTLEPQPPMSCANSGNNNNLSSEGALGANGVLGVGLFPVDCGSYCAAPVNQQSFGSLYYSCSTTTCNPTSEDVSLQVVNPVAGFAADNNGVILQLPAIPAAGQVSDTGYLVFGIGTQANNGLGDATVLTTDGSGFITTMYKAQTLPNGFLDSGSNGYFFPDSTITVCSDNSEFYCPATSLMLQATNQGQNGASTPVSFDIEDTDKLNQTFFAVNVGGPSTGINLGSGITTGDVFDFGVPFFYGRTVFTAIAGATAGSATGPYFAY